MTELALRGGVDQTTFPADLSTIEKRKSLVSALLDLSLMGLRTMYLPEIQRFCMRRVQTDNGMKNEGISVRYTLITLLGLQKAKQNGFEVSFDIQGIGSSLLERADEFGLGDLGLLLWLAALAFPERLDLIVRTVDIRNKFRGSREAKQALTTDLSWLLSGLCKGTEVLGSKKTGLLGLAEEVYPLIHRNYRGRGIFGHMSTNTLIGKIRGRIGSFADQVYPIEAFSKFGWLFGRSEAIKIAQECAENICKLQGPLGQWWWHYDAVNGRVAGRYPVYSVHQDGMAPMALFAIESMNGRDFRGSLYKGLSWILGRNELGVNLIEEKEGLIWRSLYHGTARKFAEIALSLTGLAPTVQDSPPLTILRECRPYHLGWLLYAFADKI